MIIVFLTFAITMRNVTIKDIAKELNISIATVSRALNDKYDIKRETRELVLKTAMDMGYIPNPMARKLISQRSNIIGVIIPEFINPFFHQVIFGMEKALSGTNYQILTASSSEDVEKERERLKLMENNMVEGIVISLVNETKNIDYLQKLIGKEFPIVLFNRINEELPVPKVVFDDYKYAFFATEHLIDIGCCNIVHFSGPERICLSRKRIQGFVDAIKKHRLPFDDSRIVESGLLVEGGYRCMEALIEAGDVPDGVFAVNDFAAIGAIKALRKHHINIPEEVAVIGFTEGVVADLIDPGLSSVLQPAEEIGIRVAQLILEQIEEGVSNTDKTSVLGGRINIRGSSDRKKDNVTL